jgi:hypothetical protein
MSFFGSKLSDCYTRPPVLVIGKRGIVSFPEAFGGCFRSWLILLELAPEYVETAGVGTMVNGLDYRDGAPWNLKAVLCI